MRNQTIKIIASVFLLLMELGACTSDFEELNKDPNNPTRVPTAYLLSSAQRSLIEEIYGMNQTTGLDATGMRYMQMWTSVLYTDIDRYSQIEEDFNEFYKGGLTDLNELIRLNTAEETAAFAANSGPNENQIAVARIVKVWAYQVISDIWGDIPYSEALQGLENPSPQYDPQSEIYEDLVKELNEAIAQMDVGAGAIEGDLFYDGKMESWKLFAQSLKLRVGMRMSEVAPERAAAVVKEAVSAGIFTSNNQSATFNYLPAAPNFSSLYRTYYIGTPTLAVANTMVDKLKELNDPRLGAYAQEKENGGGYVGMPYGVSGAIAGSINSKDVSFQSLKVLSADASVALLSYSEVLFFQAEAAARNWIEGDPEELYKDAIRASLDYWEVPEAQIAEYLTQPSVGFDENNWRKSIGDQKWIALYMQGLEAWSEWRRLDYPLLIKAPDAAQNREIPRRRGYPLQETSLNRANYEAAVSRQGSDQLETRVWWDQ